MAGGARRYAAGDDVDDRCGFCGLVRPHVVSIADGDGRAVRVVCDVCGSEHPFGGPQPAPEPEPAETAAARPARRGGREPFPLVSERERRHPPMTPSPESPTDLELLLRQVIREECGLTPVAPAEKWRGGELVLRPGKPGAQEKSWPIETFFHKVVMLRNRLRVLEQQLNSAEGLPDDLRVKLQGYITACYGSLTSFNVLFADPDDQFKGSGGGD